MCFIICSSNLFGLLFTSPIVHNASVEYILIIGLSILLLFVQQNVGLSNEFYIRFCALAAACNILYLFISAKIDLKCAAIILLTFFIMRVNAYLQDEEHQQIFFAYTEDSRAASQRNFLLKDATEILRTLDGPYHQFLDRFPAIESSASTLKQGVRRHNDGSFVADGNILAAAIGVRWRPHVAAAYEHEQFRLALYFGTRNPSEKLARLRNDSGDSLELWSYINSIFALVETTSGSPRPLFVPRNTDVQSLHPILDVVIFLIIHDCVLGSREAFVDVSMTSRSSTGLNISFKRSCLSTSTGNHDSKERKSKTDFSVLQKLVTNRSHSKTEENSLLQ